MTYPHPHLIDEEDIRDPLTACMVAGELVRAAGFEHRYTSMKSEATYYSLPGYHGLLRIAGHRSDNATGGAGRTVARCTLAPTVLTNISYGKFEMIIHLAMGQYLSRAERQFPAAELAEAPAEDDEV